MKKSNLRQIIVVIGAVAALFMILGFWIVHALQPSELRIVNLQGHPVLRITAAGEVFDGIDSKVAVINDLEGSFTLLKNNEKFHFRHDPAIQRDNDRYLVKLGDGFTYDVQPDGRVLVNGELYWRVFGYSQKEIQRDRFVAALAISPFLMPDADGPGDVQLDLPEHLKYAGYDPDVQREHIMWIPHKNEMYFGGAKLGESEIYWNLPDKIDELLKQQPGKNKVFYIAASWNLDYREIVTAISRIRAAKESAKEVGLIVNGPNQSLADRFLVVMAPEPDPKTISLKLNPLDLIVSLSYDRQLKLKNGANPQSMITRRQPQPRRGRTDSHARESGAADQDFYWGWEEKGKLDDPSRLSQSLAEIFQARKAQHVYRTGMEARTDLPEDERLERKVVLIASPYCTYWDVLKIIDALTGAGANPIVLRLDNLPS